MTSRYVYVHPMYREQALGEKQLILEQDHVLITICVIVENFTHEPRSGLPTWDNLDTKSSYHIRGSGAQG